MSPELLAAVSRGADVPNGAALASAFGVEAAQALGCGFAIRVDDGDKRCVCVCVCACVCVSHLILDYS